MSYREFFKGWRRPRGFRAGRPNHREDNVQGGDVTRVPTRMVADWSGQGAAGKG